ncbi:MAG TPA: Gldg family protein [Candidatus Polarisedimenticolia bacterium]|nr:Gldg family protein [Candidatus Polarisedimenticolia bacterium]
MEVLRKLAAPSGLLVLLAGGAVKLVFPDRGVAAAILLGLGALLVLAGVALNAQGILSLLKGRAAREGTADVAYVIIVALVLVALNFLSSRHHLRKDLSAQGEFTLSEQTGKILLGLPREVEARAYYYGGTAAERKMKDLLDEYHYQAPKKFRVRFIDPLKNPSEAKADGITQEQSVVLKSGSQSSTVVTGDEEALTNGILKVTRDSVKTLCFAIGHGEKDIKDTGPQGFSSFQAAVEKQQTKVESFSPAMGVPDRCAAVVVAGPRKPWLPAESEKLQAYLDQGGKAAILLDPGQDSGLEPLLARYGITFAHDLIIDRVSALFGGKADIPMVPGDGYESHPITKGFGYQTFYPLATSLTLATPPPAGVSLEALARTTPLSWGEMSYEKEAPTGKLRMDPNDKPGPLVVAAVATRSAGAEPQPAAAGAAKPAKAESRLVVFGDSDFPSNAYFGGTSNGELFLNVANWLSGQEDLVAVPPKSRLPSLVTLTQRQASLIWIVSLLVTPSAILIVGVAIWFRRRKL